MRVFVGIDAGIMTGVGVWYPDYNKISAVCSMKIHEAMAFIKELASCNKQVYVRVEDARQRKWFGKDSMDKKQGAGSVKRDCIIWEDYLTDLKANGYIEDFKMVHPIRNATKFTPELFKKVTKWQGRTNEHGRDAMMLVYNLSNWN